MILSIVILSLLLILSILLNVILFWYNRQVINKLLFVADNIGDTMGLMKEYHEHLESLYEMEMFYGDSTLRGLIDHTSFVIEEIGIFEDIYSLTREEGEVDLDDRTEPAEEAEA